MDLAEHIVDVLIIDHCQIGMELHLLDKPKLLIRHDTKEVHLPILFHCYQIPVDLCRLTV
jgi:hypothetical protein